MSGKNRKRRILIVDDQEINREMLADILSEDYEIEMAGNGNEALDKIMVQKDELMLILLDLVMPEKDGFEVLKVLNAERIIHSIPVIVISSENQPAVENSCFEAGVSDFIQKPFNSAIVKRRVRNIVNLYSYQNALEEKVESQTKQLRGQNKALRRQAGKLKELNSKIIDVLGNVVESRNLESGEHVKRVKGFTRILGFRLAMDFPELGLTEELINKIADASSLHDIGKIAIRDDILLKPGRYEAWEYEIMKTHTLEGCKLIDQVEDIFEDETYKRISYEICRWHHEKYDGKGYPDGLLGDEIPLSAQIVSVADCYDALVSERCYKEAVSCDKAFEMITGGQCGAFSEKMMFSFANARADFEKLAGRNKKTQEETK